MVGTVYLIAWNIIYDFRIKYCSQHVGASNQAHPTSDMLIALCDIYKINNISDMISSTSNSKNFTFTITAEERLLIEQYRKNHEMQKAIQKILDMKS